MRTFNDMDINNKCVSNYFNELVNQFFKILPMRENNENTTDTFIDSLLVELIGFDGLVEDINYDAEYVTLISILKYLKDYSDCPISVTKREVFKAISICKKLASRYSDKEGENDERMG